MGALNSLATLGLNLALGQQAQQMQDQDLGQERDRQIQALRQRDGEERRQQALALRRRLAEERARAGGAGVGASGGSADAILRGLGEESGQLDAARARETGQRIEELRQSYDGRRRRNLLDFAGRAVTLGGRIGGRRTGRSLLD